jgi:UDP-2,3-diacylglucosamine pyrophosphatase LpxH
VESLTINLCAGCGRVLGQKEKCKCKGRHSNVPHHFSIYSDIHDDAKASHTKELLEHMERRAALPRAHFVNLGDLFNMIVPNDTRRYMPSVNKEELIGLDDYVMATVDGAVERYSKFPWRFFVQGNHGQEFLKRHYIDPVAMMSRKLGIPYGGFSGFCKFRFIPKYATGGKASTFVLLYHHGAWGGRVIKGFGGARDYARHFDGWDCFVYGHNHQLNIHHETRIRQTAAGGIEKRPVFYVNTGTWLETYDEGETTYGEVRGYPPVALASPLITVTPRQMSQTCDISVTTG